MAGVGFELKKLFSKKRGYLGAVNAYIISAIVTEGPMILCMVLLFALRKIMQLAGGTYGTQEMFLITTTYIMIFSLILSNTVLMFASRYISDCIYEERMECILPSFYSFIFYLLIFGALTAVPYVMFLEIPILHKFLNLLQFGIMLIVWVQMSYLSAIKKYTRVLLGFLTASLVSILASVVFTLAGMNELTAAYSASVMGFFVMMLMYMRELVCFYPKGDIDLFIFFPALDRYKILIAVGFFMAVGLFGHNFVYWFSEYRTEVIRGMVYCMKYDVPCFFASLTIIPFLIIFVVSLEVNFYKAYRRYFDTIQYGGALSNIRLERTSMEKTLFRELAHVFEIQFFVEILCVSFVGNFLGMVGFDREMLIVFRYLCFGYCFYMLLKSLIILMLYFDDRKGACLFSIAFAVLSVAFSVTALHFDIDVYGLGFLGAAVITSVGGLVYLHRYILKLEYHIFCEQPLFFEEGHGIFRRISSGMKTLEEKWEKRTEKHYLEKRKKRRGKRLKKKQDQKRNQRRKKRREIERSKKEQMKQKKVSKNEKE